MKLFDIIKNIFKVNSVDEINEELIDKYYSEMGKTEAVEEVTEEVVEEVINEEPVKEEEKTEEIPETEVIVVEETPVKEEKTVEDVVNEEQVKKEEKTEEDKEEVLTKEVINSAKGNIPMDKSDLMKLHGDKFFAALYKNKKNLM